VPTHERARACSVGDPANSVPWRDRPATRRARPGAPRPLLFSRLPRHRYAFATHSTVSPRAGGRLHCPDDAQTEPREADGSRRTSVLVGRETPGSPRMQSRGVARPDDCIGQWRTQRRPVSRGGPGYLRGGRSERRRERVRRRSSGRHERGSGVASRKRARRRSPVTGSGCGSPRAYRVPRPARGLATAAPIRGEDRRFQRRLPRAYARSGDGHPGRHRIGRRSWAGRGDSLINKQTS